MSQITVTTGRSDQDGGCDACLRSNPPLGYKTYYVSLGRIWGLSLCEQCRQDLIHELATANKTKIRSRR